MKITVFGGASPKPGSDAYASASRLGSLLARQGFTVITGGYVGTMEAVSRGASEAGGHVVGITCAEVENFRPGRANRWVAEEIRYETLKDRLAGLIGMCDGAFALPGGVGTLAEISLMWNLLLLGAMPEKPLILIGPGWKSTMDAFFSGLDGYIPEHDKKRLIYRGSVDEGVELLQKWFSQQKP